MFGSSKLPVRRASLDSPLGGFQMSRGTTLIMGLQRRLRARVQNSITSVDEPHLDTNHNSSTGWPDDLVVSSALSIGSASDIDPQALESTEVDIKEHWQPAASHSYREHLPKAWYFLTAAANVFMFPYLNVYLAQVGVSGSQLGLLSALRPWLAAPAGVFGSSMADKYSAHTKMLVIAFAVSAVIRASLPLASGSLLLLMGLLLVSELFAAPVGVISDTLVVSGCKEDGDYGKQRMWATIGWGGVSTLAGWLVFKYGIPFGFAMYGILSVPALAVGLQLRYQQPPPAPLPTAAAGATMSAAALEPRTVSPANPVLLKPGRSSASPTPQQLQRRRRATATADEVAADSKASAPSMEQTRRQQPGASSSRSSSTTTTAGGQASFADNLRLMLKKPAVPVFMWQTLLMGFSMGVMATYEFLYLKQLGAPETLMGIAITLSCLTEVPAFQFQGEILKRFEVRSILHVVLLTTVLRLACYATVPARLGVWAVLPVELLHGITFGCGWGAGTVYSNRIAPPGLSATMQGIFQGLYGGVGAGIGGLVGGIMFEKYGGATMFSSAAGIVFCGWLASYLVERALGLTEPKELKEAA